MSSLSDKSLLHLYLEGKELHRQFEEGKIDSRGSNYSKQIQKLIDTFRTVLELVYKNDLFSSNEILEDLPTSTLKYILAPYYLAYAYSKISEMGKRLEAIKTANKLYSNFLQNCLNLGVMTEEEEEIFKREEKPSGDLTREEKIERGKLKTELENKLKAFEIEMTKTSNEELNSFDDELEREQITILIKLYIKMSIDELGLIEQEIDILNHMMKIKTGEIDPSKEVLKPSWEGIMTPQGRLKTFVIDKRKNVKDKMYKPEWNLPTISVEEAGEIEYLQMIEREKKSAEHQQEQKKNSDSDQDDEEEILKKREWDDWKDENPRGWGNTGSKGYVRY